jgi:hypothetical protein
MSEVWGTSNNYTIPRLRIPAETVHLLAWWRSEVDRLNRNPEKLAKVRGIEGKLFKRKEGNRKPPRLLPKT